MLDDVSSDSTGTLIAVRAVGKASSCPGCGRTSERIHSRYHRHLADLPMAGKPVRLVVRARRFHCDTVLCGCASLRSASTIRFWRRGRGGPPGSTTSSTTWGWRWVDGPRRALPAG
ncbi:transposase family protein [Xanthobacter sp. AM11]|uniref:transposase family protein n=1 Tax=Xanthobacter TaxID=279 RepID=UPI0024A63A54|nr:transposase family protein [Xanthobacter autotrophicus]MDI4658254.1 transposase family protein [Xanthobacter autotrophicus]MDI4665317.1 transposase family protein [Xanthobacter autotrophicus]